MIDEAKLKELYKRGQYHMGDIKEMCETIEALWKVAKAAKADHHFRMGVAYMNGADCALCKALSLLPDGGGG